MSVIRFLVAPLVVAGAVAAAAQQAPAPGAAAPNQQQKPPVVTSPAEQPQGFTYDPQGRRDPFVSLIGRGGSRGVDTPLGERPPGLAGMMAGEIGLRGIVASQGGFVAIVEGVDKRTYIVRAGEKLLDGTIRTITANEMVIVQPVNDPLSLEKERVTRKVLRQAEGAK